MIFVKIFYLHYFTPMVEKKTTKKVTKRSARTTKSAAKNTVSPRKKTTDSVQKVEPKTIVKTIPVKVHKETCERSSCCSAREKILTMLIVVLVVVNIVLGGMLLVQKMNNNHDKIAEIGGSENYESFKDMVQMEQYVEQQDKAISSFISGMKEQELPEGE